MIVALLDPIILKEIINTRKELLNTWGYRARIRLVVKKDVFLGLINIIPDATVVEKYSMKSKKILRIGNTFIPVRVDRSVRDEKISGGMFSTDILFEITNEEELTPC